jgi:N-acetylneuraminate lyase
MKNNEFKGVWPALLTPVHPDGKLNEAELERLIELLITQEMDGIYLLGSTGQGFLFSEEERKTIAARSIEIVNGRVPVMVQVGAMNTEESIRLARHAADKGADGISSVGPIYYSGGSEMALTHYRRIAEASDLPFFPYQIGGAASEEVISRLLDMPQVKGMKLTTANLLEIGGISNIAGDKWKLFSGADELMCQAAICGTAGAIGSFYNMFGPTCKYVRSSFLQGRVLEAQDFMLCFQGLIDEIRSYIWSFMVRGMELRHGIKIGTPKPPILAPPMPLTDEQVIAKMDEIDSFGLKLA